VNGAGGARGGGERRRKLEQALAAAKARYAAALPEQADEVRRLWEACVSAPGDRGAAEELHARAHRLAGTAGSFGFHEVSAASARMEAALVDALQTSRPLDGLEAPAIAREVEAVVAACQAAQRSEPG
jgi:HPt (histidine-containing phosphotransfer) domain-containing protein